MYQGIINIGKLSAGFQLMYPIFVSVVLCTIPENVQQQLLFNHFLKFFFQFLNFHAGFSISQKIMRKDDNSYNYFQGKRASQLLQSNDPVNRFSELKSYTLFHYKCNSLRIFKILHACY